MGQNIYDDAEFFERYSRLDRQVRGLDGAAEWLSLQTMLPDLDGTRVLDLGCGFGWFSRWAEEQGAASALGVDLSEKMLGRANATTESGAIKYQRADLDEITLTAGSFDVVFSSLALHYVQELPRLLDEIAQALVEGGRFVFSVEHPIYSAPSSQSFEQLSDGRRVWPLENYLVEGSRTKSWLVDGVVKQHRTIAGYVNAVVGAGLTVEYLDEWGPSAGQIAARPELAEDLHRPWFLLMSTHKD